MNIVFVSLEQSGHNISKNIIQEILKYKTNHKLFTFGQPKKVSNILEISKININSIMGISQILKNFLYLLKLRNHLFNQSKKHKADMIFFIDSFDFSKFFFKKYNNFKICQVVGPSVFIWRQGKAKFINDNFQKIFSIFLIEKKYYKKSKYSYIGHPSSIKNITRKKKFKKITNLGIFLGSRDQEFFNNLNTLSDFLLTNIKYKIFLFTLPKYKKYLKNKLPNNNISVILNDNSYHKYISKLDFALACSGTVHIELSLSKIPHLIFYRTSLLNYIFFKLFIN
ncbi:MAG: hypothetical protein CMI90_06180, partial [Pelagibacteraceae bacterium]|nr:hypothetical protein [Pelagibacteraceae bacterium]